MPETWRDADGCNWAGCGQAAFGSMTAQSETSPSDNIAEIEPLALVNGIIV